MAIEDEVVSKLRALPPDKQQEVLDFVESLHLARPKGPRRNLKGLWAHLGAHITAQDIADARREMWASFPREGI